MSAAGEAVRDCGEGDAAKYAYRSGDKEADA